MTFLFLLQEKGNCPIHVAVTAGQSCQVELLVTYGADPGAFDKDGLTPVDYARYFFNVVIFNRV